MNKQTRCSAHSGMGVASLLFVIVIVCISAFGVLALITARHDAGLSERTLAAGKAYYLADAAAQRILFSIDEAISGDAEIDDLAGIVTAAGAEQAEVDGDILLFTVAVDSARELNVEIKLGAGAGGFETLSYRTRPVSQEG